MITLYWRQTIPNSQFHGALIGQHGGTCVLQYCYRSVQCMHLILPSDEDNLDKVSRTHKKWDHIQCSCGWGCGWTCCQPADPLSALHTSYPAPLLSHALMKSKDWCIVHCGSQGLMGTSNPHIHGLRLIYVHTMHISQDRALASIVYENDFSIDQVLLKDVIPLFPSKRDARISSL